MHIKPRIDMSCCYNRLRDVGVFLRLLLFAGDYVTRLRAIDRVEGVGVGVGGGGVGVAFIRGRLCYPVACHWSGRGGGGGGALTTLAELP